MSEPNTIFRKIEANFSLYSEVERRIAGFLLEHPDVFIQCTMPELAKKTNVSQGSITNFAKKIVGTGFADLKLQVAQQMADFKSTTFSGIDEQDSSRDILRKTISQIEIAFDKIYELNTTDRLEKAVDLILRAKRIELYGLFLSGVAANNMQYQLMQLGLPAHYVNDVLLSPVSAMALDKSDLVIAVSNSGRTTDVLEPVKIAKNKGASLVAITSNPLSPLARLADVTLVSANSSATVSNEFSEIQMTQMLLCNSLCAHIRHIIDKDGENQFYRMSRIIGSHSIVD